jgi:diguanylate cyclase (GGDEF)-like protein
MRFLACWLAISACLQAQQYVFRALGQDEGLKNLSINAMTTDRSGFLWVATENGVYRFLGSAFQRFGPDQGIPELESEDVIADRNGTIWVGTDENLYRWDGLHFLPAGREPIPIERIRRMFVEDDRHLLVLKNERLYRLEHDERGRMLSFLPAIPDQLIKALPELGHISSVNVVDEPREGLGIWLGCGKKLCSWIDRTPVGHQQPRLEDVSVWGKDKGLAEDSWESVLLNRSGDFWVAGRKKVMTLPAGSSRFIDRSIPGSDPENVYGNAPLTEDPEGRVLAPAEDGVARWEGTGWKQIGHANGLQRISHSAAIVFDQTGDVWLGSHGGGVYHWYGYRDWEGWSDSQGLPSALVWSLKPLTGGRVLAGTDAGPAWIDAHSGLAGPLSATKHWIYGQVEGIDVDPSGGIWTAGMAGAILHIDPRSGKTVQTAQLPEMDFAMSDSKGRLFFTMRTPGIFVRETPRAAPHRVVAVDALLDTSQRIPGICESPDGAAWFLAGNSLLREKDMQWIKPPIDGMPTLHGALLSLDCASDGAIWVTGEDAGTWRLTPAGNRLHAWKLEIPTAFRALSPVAVLVDKRGWVWLGTDSGLLVWNGQAWRQITVESGLIWNDIDQGALKEGPDGSIWVGTSGGVSRLMHPELVFNSVFLAIAVTGIQREGTPYSPAQQITLPWSPQPLLIQTSSSTMRNRGELVFKYRMDGLNPDWIETQDGKAVFSALPPGNYTFMAKVRNAGLNSYSSTVTLNIRILPPWWRSSWFYALCILLLLLMLAGGDRLRARHLLQTRQHLQSLVEERTRELEASREELRIQATQDGLTGMLNHVAILSALTVELDRALREKKTLVLAMADLDHFKLVNDAFGHQAGDEALRTFAAAVNAAKRPYDHAGRYGGEEFLLILTDVPLGVVYARLRSLHEAVSNLEVSLPAFAFTITCSIGATLFDPSTPFRDAESLLACADKALYAAKKAGRNRVLLGSVDGPESVETQVREPAVDPR